MKINKKWHFLWFLIPVSAVAIATPLVLNNKQVKNQTKITFQDLNINEELFNKLNNDQIKMLLENNSNLNIQKVELLNKDISFMVNNEKYFLSNLTSQYKFDKSNYITAVNEQNGKLLLNKENNIYNDPEILFEQNNSQLAKESYKEYFASLWRNWASNYSSIEQGYLPDLQQIIQYSMLESIYDISKNKIAINNLRADSFKNNVVQLTILEKQILFYLKAFNIVKNNRKLDNVKITNITKINSNTVELNIDLLDKNNESLLNDEQKKYKFYLNDFLEPSNYYPQYQDYSSREYLNVADQLESQDTVLLNEMDANVNLFAKNTFYNLNEFDAIMHSPYEYLRFNINSFKYFIDNFKDNFYILSNNKNHEYEILDFEITNLLNKSYSIAKLSVKVTNKDDLSSQIVPWFSINFTPHKHIFDGFYTIYNLGKINPNVKNYFSYNVNNGLQENSSELKQPDGLDPNLFYEQNIKDIVNFLIDKNRHNLTFWNNNEQKNISPIKILSSKKEYEKKLSLLISQYVLNYFIVSNDQNKSLIKEVKITIDPLNDYSFDKYGLGNIPIKIDFINYANESMLNETLKNTIWLLGGFVGFNYHEIINKQSELQNEKDKSFQEFPILNKTLPYLKSF